MLNKKKAFEVIELSLKSIEAAIKEKGGSYKLKQAPAGVGNSQDKDFEEQLIDQQNDQAGGNEEMQFDDEDEN